VSEVLIVAAGRSPIGRRGGVLSGLHPATLLGAVQRSVIERAGLEPGQIGQVVGGCVTQTGEQAVNVTRTAWLAAGLPLDTAATTVDAQCGSSQQAAALAAGLIRAGTVDVAMACGVEAMSRVPIGSTAENEWGHPAPPGYEDRYHWTTQFDGAEMIVDQWGFTRADTDGFGLRSQQKAAAAWRAGQFDDQIVPIDAPVLDGDRKPTGATHVVDRDQGLRDTTAEGLARLKPVADGGVHTAGSTSQISDGASAVVLASAEAAKRLKLTPLARIVDQCLVGSDPELMLTGPIPATRTLLERQGLEIDDIDRVEINEAFASVVLAWNAELRPSNFDRINPDGGAIALGHPLGGTGTGLITKAVYGFQNDGGSRALITMCCGGGLGTGMLLEAI
jgi:acetyl-CoA C-acetyltransferase